MGNDHPKTPTSKYSSNYTEIQKQEHPFLGTITHLIHRTSSTKHFLKISKYSTAPQHTESLRRATKRLQLSQKKASPFIIRTTEIDTEKQNQLCGITHYLYTVYEDFDVSLGDMVKMRGKGQGKGNFGEEEVLECLRGVCNGLIFLQDNGYKNYTVCRESVVRGFKDQSGNAQYKIFDTELARQMLPYPKILNHIPIEKGIYLAPQLLHELSTKNPDPDFPLKSDIFSLGMVALEMCTLESLDHLYNYERLKLDTQSLYGIIKNLKGYSPYLKGLLVEMLEVNEEERIGIVSLREKLNINDNKSTTDYAFSAIGNSNVTQRTHKVSYPINNVRDPSLVRPPQLVENGQASMNMNLGLNFEGEQQRIPRVLTVDQLKFQNQPFLVAAENSYSNRKNQTFDQISIRNQQSILSQLENRQKNKSTEKYKFPPFDLEQQRKRTTTVHNFPFYYPPHTQNHVQTQVKPMTMPIVPNLPLPPPSAPQFAHHQANINANVNNGPVQFAPAITYSNRDPIVFNTATNRNVIPNTNINTHDNPQFMRNPTQKQQITVPLAHKLPQIQIPQTTQPQKNEPQTPINNLADSNAFYVSDPLSLRPKISGTGSDLEVLNSMNVGFRKAESREEELTFVREGRQEFQSPNRMVKNSYYPSNQSTPIRKVQALQSQGRNSFNQVIRQTEQQQNQTENPISLHKIIEKNIIRGEAQFNGHKTYGKHHFTNGAVYEGQFDSLGNFCGNGVLYYSNGKICYSGGWVDNSFHGFGVLNNEHITSSSGATNYQNFNLNHAQAWHHYEGQFCMDKKNGFGTLYMCNGDKFSGCFVRDAIEGYGTFTAANGDRVSGIWNQNVLKKM